MLLSMLFSCVAVEPSVTLVLLAGWAEADEDGPDLSLAGDFADVSPALVVGNGLPGLSIFTVVLSNSQYPVKRLLSYFIGKAPKIFRIFVHL